MAGMGSEVASGRSSVSGRGREDRPARFLECQSACNQGSLKVNAGEVAEKMKAAVC